MLLIRVIKFAFILVMLGFALIGVVVTAVYIGMEHDLLTVKGSIDERNRFFGPVPTILPTLTGSTTASVADNGCRSGNTTDSCSWQETAQWEVVRGGLIKDAVLIARVANETGVDARMIAAAVVPEQIRFFTDNREVFKRYFEPLKLLASLSKFSLGVSGIKQETAVAIENYALASTSEFYPGPDIAALLAYSTGEKSSQALFDRLTDDKNHYYSYLYTAIYLKEITAQWERAGFDVSQRPDVLVTLFNVGFAASQPKAEPKVGGSSITVGDVTYSFGYLGTLFYESDELIDVFPRE